MKTFVSIFVSTLALGAVAGASAQSKSCSVQAATADTVMLSEHADGDYMVHRFLVKRCCDADYAICYRINLAKLNANMCSNPRELEELSHFFDQMSKDSLNQIRRIVITGYASPDGPHAFNESLAKRRAADFQAYMESHYAVTPCEVSVKSEAADWADCCELVKASSMPNKDYVLKILTDCQPAEQKEAALKRMPESWCCMTRDILPRLRGVDLVINYGSGSIVEHRELIPQQKPEPEEVVEEVTGVIVEIPDEKEIKKEVKAETKESRREAKAAEKQARREAREAERILRQQEKAARKIAKKEAKAAKAAERAAQKSYRELEKM